MWRYLRIGILLFVLASVAQSAWLARKRSVEWQSELRVTVYPIIADRSPRTAAYVQALAREDFSDIETFFAGETRRRGLGIVRPVEISLAARVDSLPPEPPRAANRLDAIVWSLSMRWWAWRHDAVGGPRPQVRLFVLYFDPRLRPRLAHSVGLQQGLIGRVNAFADDTATATNSVVIAHELLHTLGATDKYDPATGLPTHPAGYAEPDAEPRYPQHYAELMGGRTPVAPDRAEIPASLADVRIGTATAREIRWLR